jgi:hypothetical protein
MCWRKEPDPQTDTDPSWSLFRWVASKLAPLESLLQLIPVLNTLAYGMQNRVRLEIVGGPLKGRKFEFAEQRQDIEDFSAIYEFMASDNGKERKLNSFGDRRQNLETIQEKGCIVTTMDHQVSYKVRSLR